MFLLSAHNVCAQDTTSNSKDPYGDMIFDRTEVIPSFPGGNDSLNAYIRRNMRYPKEAIENALTGKVVIKFIVEKDGNITNPVKLVDYVGHGCADEAYRLIRNMPKWLPGKQKGKLVRAYYVLPITFSISN